MTFMCRLSGYPKADAERAARRALGMVGLTDAARKNPKNLSHGMAKRLGIAQAFVGRPQVILLDEPTAGLDPVNAKGIRDLINEFRAEATVVVSSHNLREIQEMCSHVAIMDRGRLVACDTVAALTKAGRHARLGFAKPLPAEAADRIRAVPGVSSAAPEADGRWLLTLDASARDQDEIMGEVLARLLSAGCVPRSLSEGESLENRFLELTGEIKTGDVACPACGHTLFGLSQQRCPECGRPFTFVELGRSPEALGYRGRVVDEVPRFR
jgi:ABC-type multidrug transport system ATPase subunit